MGTTPSKLLPLLAATVLLAGCYLHRDSSALQIAMAVPELPESMDPHVSDRPAARFAHAAVFDALTTVDETGEVRPALATAWRPIGPTAWEFTLRQNVRFQNGEEFTARTVAFNVRRVLRRDFHSPIVNDVATLTRANPRDSYTVVLSTQQPDPILPRRLSTLYMVPADYLQRVGDQAFAREPVGTGPWKVTAFVPGEQLTLEARKGSWRGPPQLRSLDLRRVPTAEGRLQALTSGAVAIALDLPPAAVEPLAAAGVQVRTTPLAVAKLIVLDTRSRDTPLHDVRVRQALNYAVDKEALLQDVVGHGLALQGQVVGREANGYSDLVRHPYPYDPAEARRLLAEAGYPNGFALHIYYTRWPDDQERRELLHIADDLARVGILVTLEGHDRATHLQRRLGGLLSPAYYDSFPYHPTLDASQVMDYFGSEKTQYLSPTYNNDDFEEIYKLARMEMNQSIRRRALEVAMRILAESPPAIFLYQPVRVDGLHRDITDFKASPDLLLDFQRLRR